MTRSTLPPKELSKRIKQGMREAKKKKIHIGRTPRLLQRSHSGTLYMRKEVRAFLQRFFSYCPAFRKNYEYELLLKIWYENKYHKRSVPKITVEDLKTIKTSKQRKLYEKLAKMGSLPRCHQKKLEMFLLEEPALSPVKKP